MATASAERRQRLIEEAGDAAAFIKLGHDLVRARSGLSLWMAAFLITRAICLHPCTRDGEC